MSDARIVVDTSVVIAVIVGEAEKARLIEMTRDAVAVAPASITWEVATLFRLCSNEGK